MSKSPHDKMIEQLEADGLIERVGEEVKVTSRGHEWTRALIRAYPDIKKGKHHGR